MGEIVKAGGGQEAIVLANQHYEVVTQFVKTLMVAGTDYGVIPGTNGKATLLKPGAEKLCRLLNLRPTFELISSIVDFEKPLFHYHYSCSLYHNGELVGQGEGNCNSMEAKYKKQQGRIYDLTNTICKMAQKRALIAAVLCTVGASEFFTQDLEDEEKTALTQRPPQPQRRGNGEITREEWLARKQQ